MRAWHEKGSLLSQEVLQETHKELMGQLTRYARDADRSPPLALLGDFGSGRTSLLRALDGWLSTGSHTTVFVSFAGRREIRRDDVLRSIIEAVAAEVASSVDWLRHPGVMTAWRGRAYLGLTTPVAADELVSGLFLSSPRVDEVPFPVTALGQDLQTFGTILSSSGASKRPFLLLDPVDLLAADHEVLEGVVAACDFADWGLVVTGSANVQRYLREARSDLSRVLRIERVRGITTAPGCGAAIEAILDAEYRGRIDHQVPKSLTEDVLELTRGNLSEISLVVRKLVERRIRPGVLPDRLPSSVVLMSAFALAESLNSDSMPHSFFRVLRLAATSLDVVLLLTQTVEGRPRDLARALAWARASQEQGVPDAAKARELVEEQTVVVQEAIEDLIREGIVEDSREQLSLAGDFAARRGVAYAAFLRRDESQADELAPWGARESISSGLAQQVVRALETRLEGMEVAGFEFSHPHDVGLADDALFDDVEEPAALAAALPEFRFLSDEASMIERVIDSVVSNAPSALVVIVELRPDSSGGEIAHRYVHGRLLLLDHPIEARREAETLLADAVGDIRPLAQVFGTEVAGAHAIPLGGTAGARSIVALAPFAAERAFFSVFDTQGPDEAAEFAAWCTTVFDTPSEDEGRQTFWRSMFASRAGFLQSFDDASLDSAQAFLSIAVDSGHADGWVTYWNLGNVAARLESDFEGAIEWLDKAIECTATTAQVLLWPQEEPTPIEIAEGEVYAVILKQRALYARAMGGESIQANEWA